MDPSRAKDQKATGADHGASGQVARSAGLVSIAVMASRVLGLAREQIFAALFGAGYAYDAFIVAFRIPNLLRDLFGEGALSAAFVTVFSDYDEQRGPRELWRLAGNVLTVLTLVLSLVILAAMAAAPAIVGALAPDFALVPGKAELTVMLTRIMMPFLLFISLSAVVMGMLNSRGRFFIPALASSFFNLGSIVGGVGLALLAPRLGQPPIAGMAVGTLIGGMMQLGVQLPCLRGIGFRLRPNLDLRDPGLARVLRLMLPATIGLSATQVNIFVNTSFAASCVQGSVSWLNYAFRLVQLPIGLFGVALSVAVMPVLARQASRKEMEQLGSTYVSALVMVFALALPATAGLYLLADPIIALIFEHGAFTASDTLRTAEALRLYSLGLFAYSAVKVTVPAFYALDDTRVPVAGSFLAVGVNILLINLLIGSLEYRAVALSTSCAMAANFLLLILVLRRRLPGLPLARLFFSLGRILAAAAGMVLVLLGLLSLLATPLSGGIGGQVLAVALLVCGGAGVYGLLLHALGLPELRMLTQALARRLGRGT